MARVELLDGALLVSSHLVLTDAVVLNASMTELEDAVRIEDTDTEELDNSRRSHRPGGGCG